MSTPSVPIDRLNAALAGRYRVTRELGAGGMATVYLGHDLRHDRDVAIKVLRADVAESVTGDRFLREIAITARLNHPHILALLDSGQDGDLLYYVMPVATGQSLRDRLDAGRLPIDEALRVAMDVTEALVHAHGQGVVHRDIKPANVLLSGGHAIVVDFGIAKALDEALDQVTLTRDGTSLGTPAYMAPEQAAGDVNTDHRADLYAVGALAFEMIAGEPAFSGSFRQIVTDKVSRDAPSLATRRADAPAGVVRLVAKCLARDPGDRPATAEALLAELMGLAAPKAAPATPARRRAAIAGAGLALAALALLATFYTRTRNARWVHETALPSIQRLVDSDQLDSAFELAAEAVRRAPRDSAALVAFHAVSLPQAFLSDPPGAMVSRASLRDTTRWIPIGRSPTEEVRIPVDAWFYRYELDGHRPVTVMGARLGGSYVPIPSPIPLRKVSDPDADMVLLRGGRLAGTLFGLAATDTFELGNYLMNRLEVTNREYKAFVDAGGYRSREWWDSTIVDGERPVAWDAAMSRFTDRTGRPGPATWEAGAPPDGTEDHPVGGVSWYEARAFARYAGKELPTVVEWNAAAMPEAARWVVPNGRYDATGPVRGGAESSVSPRGVYDMAGNVREWTVNAREPGARFILGGGFSDPPYLFGEVYAQPEFDRSAINGIRLVRRLGTGRDLALASAPIARPAMDYSTVKPVDDATYRGYLALYDYDDMPLNATVVSRDSTQPDWVREDVQFDMPGSIEPMVAVMLLPRRVQAPYQAVVLWPASDVFYIPDRTNLSTSYADYYVRSGRAVVIPIYAHTYGRGPGIPGDVTTNTIEHRDRVIRWVKEMRRSIDYAVSREDIDDTMLAFAGTSWGGRMAGVALGIEPRFRTAVLNVAGLNASAKRPEEDPVNFLPRVRIPVLMLSGRFDSVFPLETSQRPFHRLLGSAPSEKVMILFDGGHFLPRTMMMAESLEWLDKYLGPVTRK